MTFLNPNQVVDKFDLMPGKKVADFGCGAGHFTVEMAKRVGKSGTVYAFDVQNEVLSALKSKTAAEHIVNIEIRRVDLEAEKGTQLIDNLVDLVLISNVFFQLEDKEAVVRESFRVLKSNGRLVVIDWGPPSDDPELRWGNMGPPKDLRVDKEELKGLFLQAGFVFDREFDAGRLHYGLMFKKPE